MDGADVKFAFGLEPKDAVAHLRSKGAHVTGSWRQWLDGEHARAFTVANVAKLDVVSDIQDSLVDALKNGKTLEQWRKDLIPTLQAKGWWRREGTAQQLIDAGRVDQTTGEIRKGLTPARLSTIYRTNMQSAYMAGRYEQMVAQAGSRPYWEYVAVLDSKTRPAHRALNGRVFRFDDPGWRSFYPPCGYGCRCRVRSHRERDIERNGLAVSSTSDKLSQVDVPLRGGGTAKVTRYTDASLGKPGYFQPDAGFSNNPAMSTWMPRLGDRPHALSDAFVRQTVEGPAFERFVQARGKLQGDFPVGVRQDAPPGADPGVYLQGERLAAGMGDSVSLEHMRLLPDLVAYGRQEKDDVLGDVVTLMDGDAGQLRAQLLRQDDGLTVIGGLSWNPKAAP